LAPALIWRFTLDRVVSSVSGDDGPANFELFPVGAFSLAVETGAHTHLPALGTIEAEAVRLAERTC